MKEAVWRHPKRSRVFTGRWLYQAAGGYFLIELDSIDPVTGQPRRFSVWDDKPDFNGWIAGK